MPYMILFEAEPNPGREEEYFTLSRALFAELDLQPGFIRIDRARSILTEGKLLSVSLWESEAAIEAWARHPLHREAQIKGKQGIFKHMRITRLQVLSERVVASVPPEA
ncbi:MAG: antibiotic biosynthesis monooxygenase [Deltaproteobacteria bacterium]|nr:antibiotic biosynthesis monooxygenase [Deltaproteobacteria bacterium]